ncbi:MAG: DUF2851 family protein [Cytophagaceae bacterium]
MKESFLHFIWSLQYFAKKDLLSNQQEPIEILHPGTMNTDAGPDFLNARIRIGGIEWIGNVEVHKQSSDWFLHHHQDDQAYSNVILHVVYKHDKEIVRRDGTLIPTIELQGRISQELILKYSRLVNSPETIPCSSYLRDIERITQVSAKENALFKRLSRKAGEVKELLIRNKNDWEETAYQILARNFGFKVNSEPFFRLSTGLPYKIISRHRQNIFKLEALLFGQSGLLDKNYEDEYPCQLKKEYEFLSHKYSIADSKLDASEWKFLRTRPANFPSVRIAEFASLISRESSLFSSIIQLEAPKDIYSFFRIKTSDYWSRHYIFDKEVECGAGMLGKSSIENLTINSLVPLMVSYSKEKDEQVFMQKALDILEFFPAESNKIISLLGSHGLEISNAFDSQAALELYNNYCRKKNCLNCNIGTSIVKTVT